jgi:YD repeat-containing protein
MKQVTQSGTGVAAKRVDFTYNALDQFSTITRYSDLAGTQQVAASSYTWDAAGRLGNLRHTGAFGTRSYVYVHDDADRITSVTSFDGTTAYTYDRDGQLLTADHSYQTDEWYTYDYNGNRRSGGFIPPATGQANRLAEDAFYTYQYDAEGNRIRRTRKSDGSYEVYEWDHRNRLTSVETKTSGGAQVEDVTYKYDVFDRRIGKTVDWDGTGSGLPVTTRYVFDGLDIALQFDGAGTLTNRYLQGPASDQALADEYFSGGVSQGNRWALTDHLGTVRDLVDNSGAVVKHVKYDSFGNRTSDSAPSIAHQYGFQGLDWLPEIEQSAADRRGFESRAGRAIQEDIIGFRGRDTNLNRWEGNRTTTHLDPDGTESFFYGSAADADKMVAWLKSLGITASRVDLGKAVFTPDGGTSGQNLFLILIKKADYDDVKLKEIAENAKSGFDRGVCSGLRSWDHHSVAFIDKDGTWWVIDLDAYGELSKDQRGGVSQANQEVGKWLEAGNKGLNKYSIPMPDRLLGEWTVELAVDTRRGLGHVWLRYHKNGQVHSVQTVILGFTKEGARGVIWDEAELETRETTASYRIKVLNPKVFKDPTYGQFLTGCADYAVAVFNTYLSGDLAGIIDATFGWIGIAPLSPRDVEHMINSWDRRAQGRAR